MIATPTEATANAIQVALRTGSASRPQARMAVKKGAMANRKTAFATVVDWIA